MHSTAEEQSPISEHFSRYLFLNTYLYFIKLCLIFSDSLVTISTIMFGDQGLLVRVQLLAMCRGELSAVIARLMSKCL